MRNIRKIFERPLIINKSNGQIGTYFKKSELPKEIRDALKSKDSKIRKIFLDIKRVT